MTKNQNLNLKNLYRIPWSTYNNPNGWIEPTTYCQLACPGCYRGLDQKNPPRIHEDLEKLKKEIDTLIKIRNIQMISIAGGEPLLYPNLGKLISYAHQKWLKVRIVTNGVVLTKKKLQELKNFGVNEVVIHLAQYQKRGPHKNEREVNLVREKYCQMFREIKGVDLQFIMTVSAQNINTLPDIIKFYKRNSDIVSHVIFTLYQQLFPENNKDKDLKIETDEIRTLIEREYKINPCAYLPKTLNPNLPSWLFYIVILHGNEILGFADGKTMKKLFELKNKEFFPIFGNKINIFKSAALISVPQVKKMIQRYFLNIVKNPKYIFKLPHYQAIIIINTPDLTKNGWSICDGCPDAMLYNDKLVPSCALERIKKGDIEAFRL